MADPNPNPTDKRIGAIAFLLAGLGVFLWGVAELIEFVT